MADINQTSVPHAGEGLRKIKKIKRPIKRLVPGNPMSPSNPQTGVRPQPAPQPTPRVNPNQPDLDELLDNQLNLPALKQAQAAQNQPMAPQQPLGGNDYQRPNRFISENDLLRKPRFVDELMEGNLFTLKGVVVVSILVFILGILCTKIFSGGKTVVKDGLQGVVVNAEVPRGRARCGVAEKTQGCVLYIMNPQRQDLQGRDFYDLASQLTGRQRFVVETGNMRYSSVKIRPGDIAQINIPPLQ